MYALIFRDPDLRLLRCFLAPTSCLLVDDRNRNAIEDELEVLYDAYYEELEQYANYQQRYVSSGGTLPPPPGPGPFPGSVELDKNGAVVGHHKLQPPSSHPNLRSKNPPIAAVPNGRGPKAQVKHPESEFEDDQDEDEYEEDDEYEAEEEEEEDEDEDDGDGEGEDGDGRQPRVTSRRTGAPASTRRRTTADAKPERDKLFSFGSSLTVTGKSIFPSISVELSRLELVHLNLSRNR